LIGSEQRGYLVPPINTGLEGLFLFDGTRDGALTQQQAIANAVKNRVEGKPDAVAVGAPVANARSMTFLNFTNFLQTLIAETDNMTAIVVNRGDYAGGNYVSNTQSKAARNPNLASYGFSMHAIAATPSNGNSYYAQSDQYDSANGAVAGTAHSQPGLYNPDDTSWMAWSARISETVAGGGAGSVGIVTRDILTIGSKLSTQRAAGLYRDHASGALRIGSGNINDASKADPITMAMVLIYSQALSDPDLAKTYQWIKQFCAGWHGFAV